MDLPFSVSSQMISEVKIAIVSNIVLAINGYTDQNTILFITIRIMLQTLANSQTLRLYLDDVSDFILEVAL